MKIFFASWFPQGLAARFVWLLVVTLLAANLSVYGILSLQQTQQNQAALEGQEIERIVALVPALESVTADIRPRISRHASTRMARVSVGLTPLVETQDTNSRSVSLSHRLSEALEGREVRVAIRELTSERLTKNHSSRTFKVITFSIALNTESTTWLNIATSGERYFGASANKGIFFLILGVSLIALLGVGLLFVRRLTHPFNELAKAARAAGQGDRSIRLVENGAREVRDAAKAFNSMQAQIASFDAERTRTLAAVGHDLRTPITSLRIRVEMLEDEAREPMIRTLEEMAVMTDSLVAFARGESEYEQKETLELGEFLAGLCEARGAEFTMISSSVITARPVKLTRAFGNLIDNALRYGKVARVALACQASSYQASSYKNSVAVITLEDDGPGIPEELLGDIFEPFVRGDTSRNPETGGAGLGLSIVRQIIREQGGTVELENLPEKGLRATVKLPL